MSKARPSILAPSKRSFLSPSCTGGSQNPGFRRRDGAGKAGGLGERIERAARRCGGETIGRVNRAIGPERRGVRGWRFCFAFAAKYADAESACVRDGAWA